ncbi:MAG TPA: tRNA adenosine(34) deaminase TadA [Candidatus Acidoferrum sp.]|nr:tRNA adenosine(34) deaminase TadA [Candidatus Acidoferrum sp.]
MECSLFRQRGIVKQSAFGPCKTLIGGIFVNPSSILLHSTACYSHCDMDSDTGFMQKALEEARSAAAAGEVPVGAVLVDEGRVIARSGNRTIRDCDPTAHAEIIVLRKAARVVDNYRLAGTTLYVTIEPCSMCAGAMIQARIPRLVYGANDPKAGAVRTYFQILSNPSLNHQVEITAGVLAAECAEVIRAFFAERR